MCYCKWEHAREGSISLEWAGRSQAIESSLVELIKVYLKIVFLASLGSRGQDSTQFGSRIFWAILIFWMKSSAIDWIDGTSSHFLLGLQPQHLFTLIHDLQLHNLSPGGSHWSIPSPQLPLTCTNSHSQGVAAISGICLQIHPNLYEYMLLRSNQYTVIIHAAHSLPCLFHVVSSSLEMAVEGLRFGRHLRLLFSLMPPSYLEALQQHHCWLYLYETQFLVILVKISLFFLCQCPSMLPLILWYEFLQWAEEGRVANFHFLDEILTYAGRNCISKMFAALILLDKVDNWVGH